MLGQMLNASKNIKSQVIDLIPGFVCARSKWFKRLGGVTCLIIKDDQLSLCLK